MSSYNSLEKMLSNLNSNSVAFQVNKNTAKKDSEQKTHLAVDMMRADKSASFEDFISMVAKLTCLVLEDYEHEVIFIQDENSHMIVNPDQKTDKVYITYKLISRAPHREIKPMIREEIVEQCDKTNESRLGEVYGQRFSCEVQFNIFASEYKISNEVMKMFEDMIFSFTGYMKENGVSNILFKKQLTDTDYDIYRRSMSVRNLRYHVETEHLIIMFNDKIQSIIAQGNL